LQVHINAVEVALEVEANTLTNQAKEVFTPKMPVTLGTIRIWGVRVEYE